MTMMIGKTIEGAEYMYNRDECYAVSDRSAKRICATLNEIRWRLDGKQKWHVYDFDEYKAMYTAAGTQAMTLYKGEVRVKRKYTWI